MKHSLVYNQADLHIFSSILSQASFMVVILKVLAKTRVNIIIASITMLKKAPNHLGLT
jgi:hypothetical protein